MFELSKGYALSMGKFMGGRKIFDSHLSNPLHLGFTSWVNIVFISHLHKYM